MIRTGITITIPSPLLSKSMRGSDPDAAVYYLARMLYAGEDVKFIARRIMILCIGGCRQCRPDGSGCSGIGGGRRSSALECRRHRLFCHRLSHTWHARQRAMHAYNAISTAMSCVKQTKTPAVPAHLQDAHYRCGRKARDTESGTNTHTTIRITM